MIGKQRKGLGEGRSDMCIFFFSLSHKRPWLFGKQLIVFQQRDHNWSTQIGSLETNRRTHLKNKIQDDRFRMAVKRLVFAFPIFLSLRQQQYPLLEWLQNKYLKSSGQKMTLLSDGMTHALGWCENEFTSCFYSPLTNIQLLALVQLWCSTKCEKTPQTKYIETTGQLLIAKTVIQCTYR